MESGHLRGRAAVIVAGVAIASVGAGAAWGAIPSDEDGTIDACYRQVDGVLRVIDYEDGQRCKKGEQTLTWRSGAGSVELTDGAVTTVKIADNAVTTDKIADGTIADGDISSLSGSKIFGALGETATIAAPNITGTIDASQIGNGLTSTHILDGTIFSADLAGNDSGSVAGAVTSEKILDGTIEGRDFADSAVTFHKLASQSVRGGLDSGSGAVANNIEDGSVSESDIAAGAVTNAQLASPLVRTTTSVPSAVPIDAGTRQEVSLAVPGVTPGDAIYVAPPALQGHLVFGGAAITAPDVVTVYLYNPSPASSVDVSTTDVFEVFTTDLTPSP